MRPSSRNSFSGPQVGAARGLGEGRAAKFRTVRTCLLQIRSPTHPSAILTGGSVTTQPGAEPSDSASASQTSASQTTKPLRDLGALVLVGANAVFLVVALLNLLFTDNDFLASSFPTRAARSFDGFVNLATIALPFVAVLLATHVQPAIARARLITLVALVEYGVSIFFGAFFGLLVGLVGLVENSAWTAFLALLTRLAWLALLVTAAHIVYASGARISPRRSRSRSRSRASTGRRYGQPGYPQHGGYPYPPYQSAGYGQPYGQPSASPGPSQPRPSRLVRASPARPTCRPSRRPRRCPLRRPRRRCRRLRRSRPARRRLRRLRSSGTEATQAIRMPEPPAGSGRGGRRAYPDAPAAGPVDGRAGRRPETGRTASAHR